MNQAELVSQLRAQQRTNYALRRGANFSARLVRGIIRGLWRVAEASRMDDQTVENRLVEMCKYAVGKE